MLCLFLLLLGSSPIGPKYIIQESDLSFDKWQFNIEDGALGRSSYTENSRSGSQALLVENSNGIGSVNLKRIQKIPVKPGTEYEGAVYFQLLDWQPLASMRFSVREISSSGETLAFVSRGSRRSCVW